MKDAFVKTNNGNFPNLNFYLAWDGFSKLMYDVHTFETIDEALSKGLTKYTPFFAGVQIVDQIIERLNLTYNKVVSYPDELKPFLQREIKEISLFEFKNNIDFSHSLFIKPVKHKQFSGKLIKSFIDLLPIANLSDDTKIYVSEPIEIISEYRVYIQNNSILAGRLYNGDWTKSIDIKVVEKCISTFKHISSCAYALDFGLLKNGNTVLIEANDMMSLGNYGLNSITYASLLDMRWTEICNGN